MPENQNKPSLPEGAWLVTQESGFQKMYGNICSNCAMNQCEHRQGAGCWGSEGTCPCRGTETQAQIR